MGYFLILKNCDLWYWKILDTFWELKSLLLKVADGLEHKEHTMFNQTWLSRRMCCLMLFYSGHHAPVDFRHTSCYSPICSAAFGVKSVGVHSSFHPATPFKPRLVSPLRLYPQMIQIALLVASFVHLFSFLLHVFCCQIPFGEICLQTPTKISLKSH